MFPQFSTFWNNFYTIGTIWMMFLVLLFGIALISSITNYFGEKRRALENQSKEKIDYLQALKYSNQLLDTISLIAKVEVTAKLQSLELINVQYDIAKLDSDIKEISSNIFKAIKASSYQNENCIFDEDYLFKFIYKMVSMNLMEDAVTLNSKIRETSRIS